MYAPLDVNYASDLPQREQDIDQAKSLLASAGQEGLQVELFTGDGIGSVAVPRGEPLRRAGQGGRGRGQGHEEDRVLRRRLPDLPVRPGLLEHPQLHPAGRGRHVPAGPGRHLQRDALGQRRAPRPGQRGGPGARRGQAQADLLHQAQEIEYNEGGLIIWGFRQQVDGYAANVQGLEPSKYLPLGNYKFNKVSVST